jgi:succinyl-CoA synthetase beta subunit
MNLHEYQGKALFAEYGLPVSKGFAAGSVEEALAAADKVGGDRWVVKAQVHAGGRGKAGGVKLVSSKDQIAEFTRKILGTNLVTYQTDHRGQPVNKVLVESCTDIAKELYLGAVVDRGTRRVTFMASTEGGVEIEEVAHHSPEKILKITVDPLVGAQPYQGREVGFKLGLTEAQVKQFVKIYLGLAKLFQEKDVAMIEINPLVITTEGNLHCLDAKVVIDDNAMFRHPELEVMRDLTQEDEREQVAQKWELNYVALDGNIGCMVNGAGLAMATMDMVKLHGGEPANFLDVGGGANRERVTAAFKLILSDKSVKGIFVNIFGGIVRCDMIAEGIMAAVQDVGVEVPVVVRLQGTNSDKGSELLSKSGLNIIAKPDFTEAAQAIVEAVRQGSK